MFQHFSCLLRRIKNTHAYVYVHIRCVCSCAGKELARVCLVSEIFYSVIREKYSFVTFPCVSINIANIQNSF